MKQEHILTNAKILIVDDQEDNAFFLEQLLSRKGYINIVSLTDPRNVLPLIKTDMPDIILLDLMMPHLDGFAIMEQLNNLISKDDFLPILVLTADAQKKAKKRALSEGALDFLIKPLDASEVLQRTYNLLHTRFLHKQQRHLNASLEQKVTERTEELTHINKALQKANLALEEVNLEVLSRLARAAEYRDDDTGEHTHRVGQLAYAVAKTMDLGEDFCDLIIHAARLHDVGKIGIPDSILLKPGRLTDKEMAIMKTHCAIGADLLAGGNSTLLNMAETIALSHHEHWNGHGYPKGLTAEDIPIEGRIVAVVDVFDALTHSRPYKQAWPKERALDLLEEEKAKHFDPTVVAAFLEVINET